MKKFLLLLIIILFPSIGNSQSSGGIYTEAGGGTPDDNSVTTVKIVDDAVTAAKVQFNWALSGSEGGSALQCVQLVTNPTDCPANTFASSIDTFGNITCSTPILGTETNGNYATSSSEGGPALTSVALATNPTDCGSNTFAVSIDSSGNLTCLTPALGVSVTGNYAGSSSPGGAATTATALVTNPTDCSGSNFANAIDASGNLTCALPGITVPGSGTEVMTRSTSSTLGVITNSSSPSAGALKLAAVSNANYYIMSDPLGTSLLDVHSGNPNDSILQVLYSGGVNICLGANGCTLALNGGAITIGSVTTKVLGFGGSSHNQWYQWAGQSHLSSNGTNATATMATTGLSMTLTTGRNYDGECTFFVNDSVAGEGVQVDFNGGTATATDFRAHVKITDTALIKSQQVTSLSTAVSVATVTGDSEIQVHFSFESSGNGTFIPRYAQATHSSGTLTIYRGSFCRAWDSP